MIINIPPAALEAGARAIADTNGWRDEQGVNACIPVARAAFLAIVENWEGGLTDQSLGPIILPLPPQENSDDQ